MNDKLSFDKCLAFIGAQLETGTKLKKTRNLERRPPTITISRETGAGGVPIAQSLAEILQQQCPKGERPWTVFDKNLVEQVLADHNLPKELARFMPEDRVSQISDMIEELLGLHPPTWTLLRQTTETILHLAELGNVILVGRAANVITNKLDNTLHVRLVGSPEIRAQRVAEFYQLKPKAAKDMMNRLDQGRRRYLRRYFHSSIDDPMLYHLTINTDLIPLDDAAHLIAESVLRRFYLSNP